MVSASFSVATKALSGVRAMSAHRPLPAVISELQSLTTASIKYDVPDRESQLIKALLGLGISSDQLFNRGQWIGEGGCALTTTVAARYLLKNFSSPDSIHYCYQSNVPRFQCGHAFLKCIIKGEQRDFTVIIDPTSGQFLPLPTEDHGPVIDPLVGRLDHLLIHPKHKELGEIYDLPHRSKPLDELLLSDQTLRDFFKDFGSSYPQHHIEAFIEAGQS
jgi:hypothetical protein